MRTWTDKEIIENLQAWLDAYERSDYGWVDETLSHYHLKDFCGCVQMLLDRLKQ